MLKEVAYGDEQRPSCRSSRRRRSRCGLLGAAARPSVLSQISAGPVGSHPRHGAARRPGCASPSAADARPGRASRGQVQPDRASATTRRSRSIEYTLRRRRLRPQPDQRAHPALGADRNPGHRRPCAVQLHRPGPAGRRLPGPLSARLTKSFYEGAVPDAARFPPNRAQARLTGPPFLRWAALLSCRRRYSAAMIYFLVKAALTGLLAAAIAEIARRYPRLGRAGRLASADFADGDDLAVARHRRRCSAGRGAVGEHLLVHPAVAAAVPGRSRRCSRAGVGFWPTMGLGVALTLALYAAMFWAAPRLGIAL